MKEHGKWERGKWERGKCGAWERGKCGAWERGKWTPEALQVKTFFLKRRIFLENMKTVKVKDLI